MCRFMCSARWSEREKARSQRWHWNGRWPPGYSQLCVAARFRAHDLRPRFCFIPASAPFPFPFPQNSSSGEEGGVSTTPCCCC
ncbi:hypothetical protein CRUP_022460 [Coryphaenoides rupestris]|nr:hypothetical protein CRUP_022460 [Coryphaenoides rupestris]